MDAATLEPLSESDRKRSSARWTEQATASRRQEAVLMAMVSALASVPQPGDLEREVVAEHRRGLVQEAAEMAEDATWRFACAEWAKGQGR